MGESSDPWVASPRVRIVECAHDGIQELFNRDSSRATKPMDERNFPKSFWIPPTKKHTSSSEMPDENHVESFSISHRKSNSSPSCIGTNVAYLPVSVNHSRQKSLDTTRNGFQNQKSGENTCSSACSCNTERGPFNFLNSQTSDSLTSPICELPPEFQMAINENKQVYFLNHETKQTTWFDPRIPPDEQKWGMTLDELDQIHKIYARRLKLSTQSLEGQQLPTPTNSVLSQIDTAREVSKCIGRESSNCCSTLPASPNNTILSLPRIAPEGSVRPASVPRMQHLSNFATPNNVTSHRAYQMNLLPPQCSKQPQPRLHQQQHVKSSSQPAPMSVSGLIGSTDSCMIGGEGVSSTLSTGYTLVPSSSLTGLHHGAYGSSVFSAGEPIPTGSSRPLAKDMEELSLNQSLGGETSLPHLRNMFCTAPLLPLLSQSPMESVGEYGTTAVTHQISSAQHSHQSSMDSGVGPSVIGGHSIPSANHTPEHANVACFDSNMDSSELCPDYLSYSAEWCQSLDYSMPERISPHQLNSVSGIAGPARTQQ